MSDILSINTITEFNSVNNQETLHPLVSIIDLDKTGPKPYKRVRYGFYTVFFKKIHCGDLRYGLKYYDYEEGTLIFIAPGQVIGENKEGEYYQPSGLALAFHPDLLPGTVLQENIHHYTFFSYAVNEALHLSEKERKTILDGLRKIQYELEHAIDKHSKHLIAANIELFLSYCRRFYDRQFITRDHANKSIIQHFEELLNNYFVSTKPAEIGLPTVAHFAGLLHLSANYFGDMIKKETGRSAQEYIQNKTIDVAKTKLFDTAKTINEIAWELGFKYPQHFTRVFKQKTGHSPREYRSLNFS